MTIRLYLEIAAVIVLLVAFGLFVHHERVVGAHTIAASDAKATAAVQALAEQQSKHLADLSTQAEQAAQNEQKAIDNYALAHPIGAVSVCHTYPGGSGLPKTSPHTGGAESSGARPNPLSAVPASPDIGPALGELMLDAESLAIKYREWQAR